MMKLYFTGTSPFSRKILVAATELGLRDRIETEFLRAIPSKPDATLSKVNPLSKIPALVLEDGTCLYDSTVICEYLDSIHAGKRLISASSAARVQTLRIQALCDGILDAAILVFYEKNQRPQELHWDAWLSGQTTKATQGLDALENDVASFGAEIDLAQISAAVTVSWLEFRSAVSDWRANRPKLAAWYATFSERPSMKATEYKA